MQDTLAKYLDKQKRDAVFVIHKGPVLFGKSIGSKGKCFGEACFTTGMTGYQHSMTDPSFAKQIIIFTFPHIGTVGINELDNERNKIFASGIVIRELSTSSHNMSISSVEDFLKSKNTVGITNIETRQAVNFLSKNGNAMSMIYAPEVGEEINIDRLRKELDAHVDMLKISKTENLSALVYESDPVADDTDEDKTKPLIAVVDLGVKFGILRMLRKNGCRFISIPGTEGFSQKILELNPHGILISNGPGDPRDLECTIGEDLKVVFNQNNCPVLCICLGHQLLGIAENEKIFKMQFGHRGINHPVSDAKSGSLLITSQNHGYAVESRDGIPTKYTSLFDKSNEGMEILSAERQIFSTQFHPEGSPGPKAHSVFEQFASAAMQILKTRNTK